MSSSSPTWLRHPLTWVAVLGAALMGALMVSSYIGGLLDPEGHLENAPIGFVNADTGVTVGTTKLDAGDQVEKQVVASGEGKVDWQVLKTQEAAERKLRDNDLWGVIVVPPDFSKDIAGIATQPTGASSAQLLILQNEGSGLFQPSVFDKLSAATVLETNKTVQGQLVGLLAKSHPQLSPADAAVVGQPVTATTEAVVSLPAKSGRGLAPFYLSVMITLTGFLAASIVGIGIDLLRGGERLERFGRVVDFRPGGLDTALSPFRLWAAKAVPTVVAAALGGVCAVGTALWIFGMDVSSAWKAYGLGVLGAVAIALVSLVFLTWFGIAGELLGVLFTTIFGVPAALGIYPYQAIPGFFQFVSAWHPLRYLVDAMRSVAFFDGSGAGLGRGVTVVAVWLVGALVVGAVSARLLGGEREPSEVRRGSEVPGDRAPGSAHTEAPGLA